MPRAICDCGCGELTLWGRFKRGHYQRTVTRKKGYPQTMRDGKVVDLHLVIAEQALGRPLPVGAEVHHVDGNRQNPERTNLVICQDVAYHRLLHARARIVAAGGNPDTDRLCGACGIAKHEDEFHKGCVRGRTTTCRSCTKARDAAKWLKAKQDEYRYSGAN